MKNIAAGFQAGQTASFADSSLKSAVRAMDDA